MKFELKILDIKQELDMLILEANSIEEAQVLAKNKGYVVLAVSNQTSKYFHSNSANGKLSIIQFSHELHALLKSGLSLMEAMETLREKESRTQSRQILDQLMQSLNEGLPFSSALELHSSHFPSLYIAMIRASEKTGDLVQTLKRFV